MLELELLFTGLGITKRDDIYVCRSLKSFGNLLDTIAHKPITLEHPSVNNEKSLLLDTSSYQIIGSIKEVSEISDDYIKVIAIITDPKFISFYNSLTDDEKTELQISPAVVSHYGPSYDLDGFTIVEEIIDNIDHHALLYMNDGYWTKYVDVQPVMDIVDESNLQHNINNYLNGEESMADFETKSTSEVEELKDSETTEKVEENKIDEDVDKRELIREEMAIADKPADEFKGGAEEKAETIAKLAEEEAYNPSESGKNDSEEIKEESVEEKVEELINHEQEEAKQFEELAEDHEELDNEDEIIEEFETPEDIERELAVKLVQNLIDSVEGFRKPYIKGRVKADTYIRKALSLNKDFIDSKYHTSIDSISAELGKELLSNIKPSAKIDSTEDLYKPKELSPGVYTRLFKF